MGFRGTDFFTVLAAIAALKSSIVSRASAASKETNIVPGLSVFHTDERLRGRLVFIAARSALNTGEQPGQASLFSFDLQSFSVTRLARTPEQTLFSVSKDGKMFAVQAEAHPGEREYRKLFLYSDALKKEKLVTFPQPIESYYPMASRVFVAVGEDQILQAMEYDLATMQQTNLVLPCGRMSGSRFGDFHVSETDGNALHFDYSRLRTGKPECENGVYSYDLRTRQITYVGSKCYKSNALLLADGKYLGFEGDNGPEIGTRLVSVNSDHYFWLSRGIGKINPASFERKLVMDFGKFRDIGWDRFQLQQSSPDGRYALVRFERQVRKTDTIFGTLCTYYIVNGANNKVEILCKDELALTPSGGNASTIDWAP
jgi:hypothetical protein